MSIFIGSADWMFRNLSKRIEVVTPMLAAGPSSGFGRFSTSACAISAQAWVLDAEGKYVQLHPASGSIGPEANGTHQTLMNLALARAKL